MKRSIDIYLNSALEDLNSKSLAMKVMRISEDSNGTVDTPLSSGAYSAGRSVKFRSIESRSRLKI